MSRMSAYTVKITLPKLAHYQIAVPETITFTVPPSAVLSAQTLAVPGPLTIMPTPGTALLSGSPLDDPSELYLRTSDDNRTLAVELQGDTWAAALGAPQLAWTSVWTCYGRWWDAACVPQFELVRELIDGLQSQQAEPHGFNALLNRSAVQLQLTSPTRLELSLPPMDEYDITAPETILITVAPPSRLTFAWPTKRAL